MGKSNNSIAMIGIAAVAAGALLYSQKASAADKLPDSGDKLPDSGDKLPDTPDKLPDTPDKLPDTPDKGTSHATIGKPYVPGDAAQNVKIAVQTKPLKHPVGLSKGERDWQTWLANVAYWETYPTSPIVIPARSEWAGPWTRIYAAVGAALKPTTKGNSTPKGHTTIGVPYRPGRANMQHNATTAVKLRPSAHPVGKSGSPSSLDWLANVAYWETFPQSPVTITSSSSDEAKAWKQIRAMVAAAAAVAPGTETGKKSETKDKKSGLHPTLGQPYRPGSDQERHNAAIAVRTKPSHHPRNVARKAGQSDVDWLANVAFWESWPAADTVLKKGSLLAPAWLRVRGYVVQELANTSTPKTSTPKTSTPKTSTPKTSTPKTSTPKTSTPKTSMPGTPGDLVGNVALAIRSTSSENDRSNAAYWMTWPDAPKVIGKGDKANAKRWISARDEVRRQAGGSTPKTSTPKTSTPGTPGDLVGNVALAIRSTSSENDRSNAAYWMTWPDAPKVIGKGDKANAKRWISARDEVRRQAGTTVSGDMDESAPPALATLPPDDIVGAREIAQAARAMITTPHGPDLIRRAAETAFGRTYPAATRSPAYDAAARRILGYVQRNTKLLERLAVDPRLPPEVGKMLACVLVNASNHRNPATIANRIAHAVQAQDARPAPSRTDSLGDLAQLATAGEGAPPTRAYWAASQL